MIRETIQNPRRLMAIACRNKIENLIQQFFLDHEFYSVRTPLLVSSPGMEPHIRPFEVMPYGKNSQKEHSFLHTSPEFAMKKLLVGGLKKIFQICPAFRAEPKSTTHLPEFTLLEWYRAHSNYEDIMNDVENMISFLAKNLFNEPYLTYQGNRISLEHPWPRLKIRDLFREKVNIELFKNNSWIDLRPECKRLGLYFSDKDSWDDLFYKIWLNFIEPTFPQKHPVIVYEYPASQAALANLVKEKDGSYWAKRFEVYIGGLELANAFDELIDPKENLKRFKKDMEIRKCTYGNNFPSTPIDSEFISALEEGLPPCSGIALGVDRLIMLFADEPDIEYTVWLPPHDVKHS